MPASTGSPYSLPYPVATDVPDVPSDMKRLAEAVAKELGAAVTLVQPPIGTILALKAGATIPAGWALCNGAGGTPNLAGKTLIGSGTATDGTHLAAGQSTAYVAGQTGGAAAVKLTDVTSGIGVHAHVGSTTINIPAHSHSTPAQTVTSSSSSGAHTHTGTSASANRDHAHTGSIGVSDRSHTHTGSTGSQNRNHEHGYTASQAINNAAGVAGLQDQSPNYHRGNIAIGRQDFGSGSENRSHEHGFTTSGYSTGHHHAFTGHGQSISHEHTFTTASAGGSHSHTVAVAANTTGSAAPVAGGSVSMSASQPKDAQQAHENRMPYYVVQYIIRIS